MGVRFAREYRSINEDLTQALMQVGNVRAFFEMDEEDWSALSEAERLECVRTMADDVFYGLGVTPEIAVGEGIVAYDREHHIIKVACAGGTVYVIRLI